MATLDLTDGGRIRGTLELTSLAASGRIAPRLLLTFRARPTRWFHVVLEDVSLTIRFNQERIGAGRTVHTDVSHDMTYVNFEIPTTHRLIRHITDGIPAGASVFQLEAQLEGLARWRLDPEAPSSQAGGRLVTDPPPGEWATSTLGGGSPVYLQITRSEWFERILGPTRNEHFRYLEIALPRNDVVLATEWGKAVNHLANAEKSYALGDDTAVFTHLRGALDALPGAKKQILDGISDSAKRTQLDTLLKSAGTFLHLGRHVAADGSTVGTFPVDHLDAAFALDLMRVLLSHLSLMLAAERLRTDD